MQKSPHQAETPLRHSEYNINDSFSENHYSPPNINNSLFEDSLQISHDLGTLEEFHDSFDHLYGNANDSSQCHVPNINFEAENHTSSDQHLSEATQRFAARNDGVLQRGNENCGELSNQMCQGRESGTKDLRLLQDIPPQPYNMHGRSFSITSSTMQMSSLPKSSSRDNSAPPQTAGETKFGPFSGLFNSSTEAKRHRHIKMRFDRHAYNENDPSIPAIEADRQRHVERIYNAMVRGDIARDNYKSVAMKRWTREPHYPSDLVEAYAHKVFDCLLEQAKNGFRGWHHNDYVVDDRKGNDEDRDIDCAGRLDNIILALEQEKTICEDVMNSACQIRMFVNAPMAYANRKHQNRIGNSKRPNAGIKDEADPYPRPSKVRKTGGRRNRGQSSTMSDVSILRDPTPQQAHELEALPYLTTPSSQRIAPSPLTRSCVERPATLNGPTTPIQRHSVPFGQYQATDMSPSAMSPPAMSHSGKPHTPGNTSMPAMQYSPFSLPTLPHGQYSTPIALDQMQPPKMKQLSNPWDHNDLLDQTQHNGFQETCAADDMFFANVADWSHNIPPLTPCEAAGSANLFEQYPEAGISLADIEQVPPTQISGNTVEDKHFSTFWQQGHGPQQFQGHQRQC